MRPKFSPHFVSLFGAAQVSLFSFLISGVRNLWLAVNIGPEGLGVNSISSLLITFFAFSDFGSALYLRKGGSSKYSLAGATPMVLALRRVSILSSLFTSAIAFITGFFLIGGTYSGAGIAFLAAALIYPIQASFTFRANLHSVMGDQMRGALGSVMASSLNFLISIALFRSLGIWVIAAGPAGGFALTLAFEKFGYSRVPLPLKNVLHSSADLFRGQVFLEALRISISQFLAVLLSNSETIIAVLWLALGQVGELSFVNNLLVIIGIFPIVFSNVLSSKIAVQSGDDHKIARTAGSILESKPMFHEALFLISLISTGAFQYVVSEFLPQYVSSFNWLWLLVFAYFLYSSTFYTATFAIALNLQNQIAKIQVTVLALECVSLVLMLKFWQLSLFSLAILALLKSAAYLTLHTLTLRTMSKGVLPGITRMVRDLSPKIFVFATLVTVNIATPGWPLYLVITLCAILSAMKLRRAWDRYKLIGGF